MSSTAVGDIVMFVLIAAAGVAWMTMPHHSAAPAERGTTKVSESPAGS